MGQWGAIRRGYGKRPFRHRENAPQIMQTRSEIGVIGRETILRA